MPQPYWHKQLADKPLFPDLLWSRPENKAHAGKLLIIGGNLHGFGAPGEGYAMATKAGIGSVRVILPIAVKKLAGKLLPDLEYAVSTPSGSFAKAALGELLAQAGWADSVLLAGDFGHNSETATLLESFVEKYTGQLVLTQDAIDYFRSSAALVLKRPDTCLVLSFEQLQKLVVNIDYTQALTHSMGLVRAVDVLHEFSQMFSAHLVTKLNETLVVASGGQISTTGSTSDHDIWRVKTSASACVWWLQNRTKPFEALTAAVSEIAN